MRARRKPPPNTLLTAARCRLRSPSGSGRSMSRRELAEAVNVYLWQQYGIQEHLDENDIGKYERGEYRWPSARRREAFRAVLHAATDAELGFYITRRAGTDSDPAAAPPGGGAAERWPCSPAGGSGTLPRSQQDEPGGEEAVVQRRSLLAAGGAALTETVLAAPLRVAQALQVVTADGTAGDDLGIAADSLEELVEYYAQAVPVLPPAGVYDELLGVRACAGALLRRAGRSARRRADVAVATGWLSNLLAVVASYLGEHAAMLVWCADAERHGQQAGQPELAAWATLTRATVAYYQGQARRSIALSCRGQRLAPAGTAARVQLAAQEMRARALLGDAEGMARARRRAAKAMAALPPRAATTGVFACPAAADPPYTATSLLLTGRFAEAAAAASRVAQAACRPHGHGRGKQPSSSARALLVVGLARAGLGQADEAAAAGLAALDSAWPVWSTLVLARTLDQTLTRRFPTAAAVAAYHARYQQATSQLPPPGGREWPS